jgi:hypothetical protein
VYDNRTGKEFTGEDAQSVAPWPSAGARHLSHADLMERGIVGPARVRRRMLEGVGFGPGDHI